MFPYFSGREGNPTTVGGGVVGTHPARVASSQLTSGLISWYNNSLTLGPQQQQLFGWVSVVSSCSITRTIVERSWPLGILENFQLGKEDSEESHYVSGIVEVPDISLRKEALFWPHTANSTTFILQNMSENRMKILNVASNHLLRERSVKWLNTNQS